VLQNHRELLEACDVVAAEKPSTYVEIGSCSGGTLLTLGSLCAPGALLAGIDKSRHPALAEVTGHLQANGRRVLLFYEDSVTAAPLVCGQAPKGIDLLLIDGDHGPGCCYRDWRAYFRLARPGGLVLIHDVANAFCRDVTADWERIQREHRFSHAQTIAYASRFLCQSRDGCRPLGFGLLRKRLQDPLAPY
jgi:predicted O-methyltransferase YrrM